MVKRKVDSECAYLIRGRILAEADISMNAEYYVLCRKLRNSLVNPNNRLCGLFHKGLPVLE